MPKADQIYHKRDLEKVFYYAQAVKAGNTFYVSGCVSRDAAGNVIGEGNMKAQIKGGKPGAVRFVVRRVGAHVV